MDVGAAHEKKIYHEGHGYEEHPGANSINEDRDLGSPP
jgi:hypothetical protein